MLVSQHQIDKFYKEGYVIIERVFLPKEIEEMREAIDRLLQEAESLSLEDVIEHEGSQFVFNPNLDEDRQIRRIVWAGAAEPVLLRYGQEGRLASIAAQIMGCNEVYHLLNQVHPRLSRDPFHAHHTDNVHRYAGGKWTDVNGKGSFCQTITAIDSFGDHGAFRIIPRNRTNYRLLHYDMNDKKTFDRFNKEAITIRLDPGDVVIIGPDTPHGSEANESIESRIGFINGYAYPGANQKPYHGSGLGVRL